jgi:hypothetical protein
MRGGRLLALLLGSAWLLGSPAAAKEISLAGLVFSDELGGVRLLDGWGSGTLDDPFVLVEEIVELGPAVLVVNGMSPRFGNRIRSQHDVGFALTKVVRNATEQSWTLFSIELRELLAQESPFGDGLSFGQASEVGRPFASTMFGTHLETTEPYDGIQFNDGMVAPGETATFNFVITDTTPRFRFYIMQRRDSPVAALDGVFLSSQ